jgi:exodeoxyribonuclease V beta subunit
MQSFNCLSLDCPLFGSHLLEASAGTGKTFSIEHIFVRLLLESIELEQILAVTFTRAATRELKMRIRANIEKALQSIQMHHLEWEYLKPYLGSKEAVRCLRDALAVFDQAQIFTIHGFCYRMLKEFCFEANVGALANPDEGIQIPQTLTQAVYDFIEHGIDEDLLCIEQVSSLCKQFQSIDELATKLLQLEEAEPTPSFAELVAQCKAALHSWGGAPLEENKLLEDFFSLEKNYKSSVKGDFKAQVQSLVGSFRALLKEKGSLFDFLSPENRKVKAQEPSFLHYPGFFDWARSSIGPLVKKKIFPVLQNAWNQVAKKVLAEEDHFHPDEILIRMKEGLQKGEFAKKIRAKYQAAIIDEFQDTDALQWDIFHKLFLENPLKALYLVGDPKQSIYRFRKADVYTYLKARDYLGSHCVYQLDTNFRSSKPLVDGLNALFAREWLELPKLNRTLPYFPVKAGAQIESKFPDDKGAIHFFLAEGEPNLLFDEAFLPFAVQEIERLRLSNCALLVKDRFQAQRALDFLKKRGIAAVTKSRLSLGQTEAFQAIQELFEAIISPYDKNGTQMVNAGPFAHLELSFCESRALLEEKGVVPFAKHLSLDADAMQIFELLFEWEKREGFSFEGLRRYLKKLKTQSPEEGALRRMEVNEEAVQIMTLHISKGLEFDVVFALGLISRTPYSEEVEELAAEKKRQLYVALTRAKKRLYIPFALSQKETEAGTHSPLELFSSHFEGSFESHLETLAQKESITFEKLSLPLILGPVQPIEKPPITESILVPRSFKPILLSSFTSLAKTHPNETKFLSYPSDLFTLQTMPRGADTGIAIHGIFEDIFRTTGTWRNRALIEEIVAEKLRFSPLAPWKEVIQQMVHKTLVMPLWGDGEFFTLSEVESFQVEVEFLFPADVDFVKGFIDLIFIHRKKVYFLDWKTNWLENYEPLSLQKAIQEHDYTLQASLYAEAIQRHFKTTLSAAFYVFVRGETYLKIEKFNPQELRT